jgi:hypothetical protein
LKPLSNILTTLCLLSIFLPGNSQTGHLDQSENLKGFIVDEKTLGRIPLVHIYNERTNKTSVSDTSGNFRLKVNNGDTLVFSAIGYFLKAIYITDSLFKEETVFIELSPRTYEILEARVYALGTYEQFKQKVLALRLPETRTDKLRKYLYELSKKTGKEVKYRQEMDKLTQGGVLYAIPIRSPEEIEMIKLKKILEKEKVQKIIDEKFNREILADVTGLKDEDLTEFIVFCNFSEKYLLDTNPYDILIKVLEKLEVYKKLKNSGYNFYNERFKFSRNKFT